MKSFLFSSRYRGEPRDNYTLNTSHHSPEVREIADETATARGDRMEQRAKQAVRPRRLMERLFVSAGGTGFGRLFRVL